MAELSRLRLTVELGFSDPLTDVAAVVRNVQAALESWAEASEAGLVGPNDGWTTFIRVQEEQGD